MIRASSNRHMVFAALWALAILPLPAAALAQARPDSTHSPKPTAAGMEATRITVSPARPRQGTVIVVTVRPGSLFVRADTLAVSRDSVRAVIDSARPPGDSTLAAGARLGAVKDTSVVKDSIHVRDSIAATARTVSRDSSASTGDTARTVGDMDLVPRLPAADPAPRIRATMFGEPLHFARSDSGSWSALAAVPVDAPRALKLPLIIEQAGVAAETVHVEIDITSGAYKMEKLTVAPRFGQAPDSALAARIAREQAMAADVSRRAHETPRLWTGTFRQPRAARVTSAFGDGREFNGRVQSRHMGLDLAGAVGAPVLAPDRGVVALVGDFYYAGNAVYIDHGAGLVTAYFHLSAVDVALGDTVTAGQRIGSVGATGRVTGPHLHWVARYGAVTVDPSSLLALPPRKDP
jgi:murein DD-endopeptidase MepM/ murein hydrolase activator NlpD